MGFRYRGAVGGMRGASIRLLVAAAAAVFLSVSSAWAGFQTIAPPTPVGDYPTGAALSPDGTRMFAVNSIPYSAPRAGSLSVLSTETRQRVRADIPLSPGYTERLAVSPDGTRVYVANQSGVDVVDPLTGAVFLVPTGDGEGSGIVVSPDGQWVYLTNRTSDTVSAIDTQNGYSVHRITVGSWNTAQPFGIAITPDGSKLYVASSPTRTVTVIRPNDNPITVASIPILGLGAGQAGVYSFAIAMSPDGTRAYVTFETRIAVIDTTTDTHVGTIGPIDTGAPDGGKMLDAAVQESGSTLLITVFGPTNALIRVSAETGALLDEIALNAPVTVSHRGPSVYVVESGAPGRVVWIREMSPDTTPPVVVGHPDRPANTHGWYNGDVVIDWVADDPEPSSGSATDPPHTIAVVEGATVTYSSAPSCDPEGNCASGSLPLSIDKTRPLISGVVAPGANAAGWNNTSVTVAFSCQDGLSGIASCSPPATLGGEGAGQSASGTAVDRADNQTVATVAGISIDKTPPTVGTPALSLNPKAITESTVLSVVATDALSGVAGGEFFLDSDPGPGHGTPMTLDGQTLTATIGTSLEPGVYTVGVRSRDEADNWSATSQVFLVVYDPSAGFATGGGVAGPRGIHV